MAGFLRELKRRNVVRVGLAYLVVAWLVVQIVSALVPLLEVPGWVGKAVVVLLIAGFPIALIIAWAFELTPDGLKRTTVAGAEPQSAPTFDRSWNLVIIGALVVALGATIWMRDGSAPTGSTDAESTVPAEDPIPSIAILPFRNLSSEPEQAYFSDGLAEELLNKLAQIQGLEVAARTSSFAFRDTGDDVPTIAAKLDVAHVLEGSVQKVGTRVRIRAQLIDAATGRSLWSAPYDRELNDIFAIQEEIARAVTQALRITLGLGDREKLKSATRSVDAHGEYLQGLALINEFGPSETRRAIEHFQSAVDIDPGFVDAWAMLALSQIQNGYLVSSDFETAQREAQSAAGRALALDPASIPAHAAIGHVHFLRGEWALTEEAFARAAAAPSSYDVAWDLGELLAASGYSEEALEWRQRSRLYNPHTVAPAINLAQSYVALGEHDAAETELREAEMLLGDRSDIEPLRLLSAMSVGDAAAVRRYLQQASANSPDDRIVSAVLALLESRARAGDVLRELDRELAGGIRERLRLVTWAAYFGEPELAIELARDGVLAVPLRAQILWYPVMRDARRTPAFNALVRDLGLVEYWQTRSGGWPARCRRFAADDFECE